MIEKMNYRLSLVLKYAISLHRSTCSELDSMLNHCKIVIFKEINYFEL